MPSELSPSLGLLGIDGLHYYVRDLERSRRFYVDRLDFALVGERGPETHSGDRQRSIAFRAGDCTVVCSTPVGDGGRAARYLKKHPDGIGTLAFRVADVEHCFRTLESRGGTPISDVEWLEEGGGSIGTFSITTPFGDTTFRFIERRGAPPLYPGMVERAAPEHNRFGFARIDHVTSNFQTMTPALLWLEHVLGFQRFWDVSFHTRDLKAELRDGSGLRSVVMWDPKSRIKFANNEPYRPNFKRSQINIFNEEHRGDGVQHVALEVRDILSTVRGLRAHGVEFMPTPAAYYQRLPERLVELGVGSIDESIDELKELGVLIDGHGKGSYLLQIFLKDSAGLYASPEAGPFFYEIIQRKGDAGFGEGNFRALFESIEREQTGEVPR
jgi:4-hydroxyphenylpyruvate dioxygenase